MFQKEQHNKIAMNNNLAKVGTSFLEMSFLLLCIMMHARKEKWDYSVLKHFQLSQSKMDFHHIFYGFIRNFLKKGANDICISKLYLKKPFPCKNCNIIFHFSRGNGITMLRWKNNEFWRAFYDRQNSVWITYRQVMYINT